MKNLTTTQVTRFNYLMKEIGRLPRSGLKTRPLRQRLDDPLHHLQPGRQLSAQRHLRIIRHQQADPQLRPAQTGKRRHRVPGGIGRQEEDGIFYG